MGVRSIKLYIFKENIQGRILMNELYMVQHIRISHYLSTGI